jgi:hypothetical protein
MSTNSEPPPRGVDDDRSPASGAELIERGGPAGTGGASAPRPQGPSAVDRHLERSERGPFGGGDSAWRGAAWSTLIGLGVWLGAIVTTMPFTFAEYRKPPDSDLGAHAVGAAWPLTALGFQFLCARTHRRTGAPRAAFGAGVAAVAIFVLSCPCWLSLLTK